jgi:beta-glucosidase/6-phospho-beta-glucosidase/beta-galactosidase
MFRSFFFAGFECATGFNARGDWIDQVSATHHDKHADEDYRRLNEVGIYAVREAVRWPLVDRRGKYDFSSVDPFVEASQKYEISVIWDLFHYGYPEDLDIFSEDFPKRFADYCHAAAEHLCPGGEVCYFTPINEPSYFAWAAADAARFAPHCRGRSQELKIQLIRAAIKGIDAIWAALSNARIVNVDPICRMVGPPDRPDLMAEAERYNEQVVFEGWDMLSGRLLPELGGSRKHLDIVGLNYYWTNQWEMGREELALSDNDPRLVPLRSLIRKAWERYGGELLITETSHVDEKRAGWINYVAEEAEAVLDEGVPLRGVCLYPILGMPEWHEPERWTPMGLWDIVDQEQTLRRELCNPMYEALRFAQRLEERHRLHRQEASAER